MWRNKLSTAGHDGYKKFASEALTEWHSGQKKVSEAVIVKSSRYSRRAQDIDRPADKYHATSRLTHS